MFQLIKENWFLIPAAILILAVCIFFIHKYRKAAREKKERYERQLKDQALNEALRNNMARHDTFGWSGQAMPMEQAAKDGQGAGHRQGPVVLHLVVKGRPDKSYVLNLQDPIRLGGEPKGNDIVLEGGQVAPQHCEIFRYQGHVYIRDLASGRPTVLKRRDRQTQVGGAGVQIMSGDRLLIGGIQAQIALLDHIGKAVEG